MNDETPQATIQALESEVMQRAARALAWKSFGLLPAAGPVASMVPGSNGPIELAALKRSRHCDDQRRIILVDYITSMAPMLALIEPQDMAPLDEAIIRTGFGLPAAWDEDRRTDFARQCRLDAREWLFERWARVVALGAKLAKRRELSVEDLDEQASEHD